MPMRVSKPFQMIALVVVGLLILAGLAAAMPHVKDWIRPGGDKASATAEKPSNTVALDDKDPNTIRFVIPKANEELGIRIGNVTAAPLRTLVLDGSLGPDTDNFIPVRSRFPGEVMALGKKDETGGKTGTVERDLRTGDLVHKDELLAVVWSKDLGLTKSSLLDAVSRLRLDEDKLQKYEDLIQKGAVPQRLVLETQQAVASDRNAVRSAELTLRSWRLTEEEIKDLYREAEQLADLQIRGKVEVGKERWEKWARVEVKAPFTGVILEKNLAFGSIVDTTTNLFIIGDIDHLSVWANVYEEDLPALQSQKPLPIPWKVKLKNDPTAPEIQGAIQEIRPIIDPTQHTALVKGRVPNPGGRMLIGAFITATVTLHPSQGEPEEVAVPTDALVEDGQESIVFVQPDKLEARYTMKRVVVARRGQNQMVLKTRLTDAEKKNGAAALKVGERIVTNGALELLSALRGLRDAATGTDKK